MSTYNFETVNTDVPVNHEMTSFAVLAVLGALAVAIADGDPQKKDDLLRKLDHAYLYNKDFGSSVEIARMAQVIKVSIG